MQILIQTMYPNLVKHIQKYVKLNDEEIQILLTYAKPLSVKKRENLLIEGQTCKSLYFVEQGCLRLYFVDDKGVEQITQFAIENWWLTDYSSFNAQSASQFYIQSIENSVLYTIEHHLQEQLFKELPQLERYFRLIAEKAYAATQIRIKYLYDFSKVEQLQHFSTKFPEFIQRIPQYMLASYLGFTPEYLSEIRKNKL